MIPIQELLNRIRWDEEFGQGKFAIGYYDRIADEILVVPFEQIILVPEEHFSFELIDGDGQRHMIPFHRVRSVYKDDKLIWQRE